jgi:hypothetical protein
MSYGGRRYPIPTGLMKVGTDVMPVYGDARVGFSMDSDDFGPDVARAVRYDSVAELYFALVNLNCAVEGRA